MARSGSNDENKTRKNNWIEAGKEQQERGTKDQELAGKRPEPRDPPKQKTTDPEESKRRSGVERSGEGQRLARNTAEKLAGNGPGTGPGNPKKTGMC